MRLTGQPLVAVAKRSDQPRLVAPMSQDLAPVSDPEKLAGKCCQRCTGQNAPGHQLAGNRRRIDRARTDPRAAAKEGLQRRGQVALAIVETGPVAAAAVIGIAKMAGRFGIARHAEADRQERIARNRLGGEIDHAAAEFAGIVRRIAFLHQRRGNSAAGEQIERNHPLERFGAFGQRRPVEQRQRITVAKPTDIDIAAADHAEAGNPAQSASDVAFTGAGDLGARQHRDNLRGGTLDVADAIAGNDDLAAGGRNLNLLLRGRFGGLVRCGGIVLSRNGLGRLGKGEVGRRKRSSDQDGASQPRRDRHLYSPGSDASRGQPACGCPQANVSGSRVSGDRQARCTRRRRNRSSRSRCCRSSRRTRCPSCCAPRRSSWSHRRSWPASRGIESSHPGLVGTVDEQARQRVGEAVVVVVRA